MMDYNSIRIHPIFDRAMSYQEHFAGNLVELGDALGSDCQVVAFEVGANTTAGFMKTYKNDGLKNEDWYTFGAKVLSPISGIVKEVYVNPKSNKPGLFIPSRASGILIERGDGINIELMHLQNILVHEGDEVIEGQVIAHAGNNGCSRAPHVHIGAYKDDKSLQIEFDLYKMGELVKLVGESYYLTGYNEDELNEIMGKQSPGI